MRNGEVTPVTAPAVTPVLYLDLDIVPFTATPGGVTALPLGSTPELGACGTGPYTGLQEMLITESGPAGGNPVYRIEGPLPQLVEWLKDVYGCDQPEGESVAYFISQAKLAR